MPLHPNPEAAGRSIPENYERHFVPAIGAPLADDLVRTAALRRGDRVLDVACGTGVVARLAARRVGPEGTVAGLDIHPGMLAVARSATPPDVSIDWHEGDAEDLPLPDASFDVVLCQMGLQFAADRPAALAEMRRVLAPAGRLVLNLPGPAPGPFALMGEALARHVGPGAAGFVSQVFSLHDTAEVETLLLDAGFRDVSVRADVRTLPIPAPRDFLWQYVYGTPLRAAVDAVDGERLARLDDDVAAAWREFSQDGALQLEARVVTAKAWN